MKERIDRSNVSNMFDSIAKSYDLLNHLLSFGVDKRWRKTAVKMVGEHNHDTIVDMATGTGDLAIALAKRLKVSNIYGLDFSKQMLAQAQIKINNKSLDNIICLSEQNCEATNLVNECADVVTIGFGIRNFNNPQNGLCEMYRLLKESGVVVILEFATPKGFMGALAKWYYMNVMPFMGKVIASNKAAYTYLPKTIFEFPNGEQFCDMMRTVGFKNCRYVSKTFNMVNIYYGEK